MAAINYAVGDNWGAGFIGNVAVPGGSQGLHGWTLEFDAGFNISDIWGAEIVSHVGNHYVIRNAAWNADVPVNGQASFGFQATSGSGGTTASGFTLNGASNTPVPPVVPSIAIDDASITEGDSGTKQMTFTVKLSQAASGPVTVNYSTANGTATAGSDYMAGSGTITFAAGETTKTITVAIAGDTAVEADETFAVNLSGANGATIADASATGTIVNNDVAPPPVVPSIAIDDASITEGDSGAAQMTFTVKLSQATTGPVTVNYATANDTATAGSDYTASTGIVTFAAGETTKTITVAVAGDIAVEANETFTVNLSGASGATIADAQATGTIVNNDVAPPPSGGVSLAYTVASNWGSGFNGAMDVGGGGAALHGWTVAFDAAFNISNIWNAVIVSHVGNHYVVKNADWNGEVAGGKTASFGFQATPGSSGGTTAAGFTVNGTAVGTPPPVLPSLTVADTTVAEGNGGMTDLAFTVSLSAAATSPVTVAYATSNGTATAGSDYTAANGTLTFAAGETSKVVHVQVSGDTAVEVNETLTLTLSSPSGATIADATAVGTITNDDVAPLPTLAVANTTTSEGNSGTADLAFTVSLSSPATGPVTVGYATSNGTATAGSDYAAASGTLTFAAGETSKIAHVQVAGDTAVEANETLTLTLSSPSGATIADGTAIGTITNDDTAPPVLPTITISDASVVEGDPGGNGGGAAPGWLSTSGNQIVDSGGHAVQIAGVNWFGFETGLMVPHGLYARGYHDMMDQMKDLGFNTIRLPFSSDMLHSTATSFNIDYGKNPDLQGLTALQIMDKIVDYADQIGLKIILDHHRSTAGDGPSSNGLWYDAQHSQAGWISDWQVLATRYAGDTAVIGADLHNEPYNGTWGGGGPTDWAAATEAAGNAIGTVNPNWLIFVEGVADYQGQSYWWGGNLMGVKDRPIDLTVDNKLVYSAHDYPNSVYAQPWFQGADFPANLSAKFDQMWGYIYKQGIAPVYIGEFGTNLTDPKDAPWLDAITSYMAGDLDNNGTTDIPASNKGVSWTFWSWNPDSGDTGGIVGNDWRTVNQNKMAYLTPIEFNFGDSSGPTTTGPEANFVLTLSAPATQTITVEYHTVPGEAGSADFVSKSGTITFAPGEQSKTVSIAITPDDITEANEHFNVVLTNAVGATIADGTGVATIIDDDPAAPVVPAITINDASITEGDSGTAQMTFTVKLSQAASGAVTVHYATANGTATAGSDYTAASGTVTFAAGETTKTITVAVAGDAAVEANETFNVVLSNPSGATITDGSAIGTIVNNDVAPPSDPAGDLAAGLALTDSWSSGFNANVTVHNDGSSTTGWQIVVDMPNLITDIWNAKVISHDANGYVIGPASWNGTLGHDGETSFGFVASGAYNASAVHVHGLGQDDVPDAVPTVPSALVSSAVSSTSTMLTWQASSVPGGGFVTGYAVFEDGHQIATTTSTSYRVTGLSPDSDYHFSVTATDAAGSSGQSTAVAVHTADPIPSTDDGHMFSPYIDMAMSQDADLLGISQASGIHNFTLAFMLSSPQGIGWQGAGTVANDTLYDGSTILSHVQDIQAAGGNITISFGGAAGTEAALAATSVGQLQAQYQSVIDRYHVDSIDFDIEGGAIQNAHANELRADAIAGLQAANPGLKVSFTLPVLPTGLTQDGLNLLKNAMDNGVHVDMVNIMTMDYGQSVDNNGQMGLSAIQASESTQAQLNAMGLHTKLGITPMIGVNDIASEVFTLSDAQALVNYARNDPDVAMLSMWSVARDNGHSAGAHYASSDSSGIAQTPFQFASIFHQYDVL